MTANSTHIGKLLGPALIAIPASEWLNLDIFSAAAGATYAPQIYLSGTLMFIAGLAIVRAHNVWCRQWPVLITLVGWIAIVFGLARMFMPLSAQRGGQSAAVSYGSLVVLLVIGIVVSYQSYLRGGNPPR